MKTEYVLSDDQKAEIDRLNNIIFQQQTQYYEAVLNEYQRHKVAVQILLDPTIQSCTRRISEIISNSNIRVVPETDEDNVFIKDMFLENTET